MKKLLILALLCLGAGMFSRGASAQTALNLADCSQSSLQTEWNAMSSGPHVLVFPSCAAGGTGAWTSTLSLTVPAGVTSVTIEGATTVSCTGTPGASNYTCSATDNTVIQDNATGSASILTLTAASGQTLRLTALTVEPYSSSTSAKSNGIFRFLGNTTSFRWDHSDMIANSSDNAFTEIDGQIEGVVDHNFIQMGSSTDNQNNYANGIRVDNQLFDTVGNGDGTWMAATQWGSQHAIFIESNYVVGGFTGDCDDAGRVVNRYNTYYDAQDASGAVHSTKTYGGPSRGCRALEFYHNYMSGVSGGYAATGGEGSSLIEWGNTLGNLSDSWFFAGGLYRNSTGVNGEPPNSNPPNGWAYCGTIVSNHFNTSGTTAPTAWDGNSSTSTGYPCLDGFGRGQQQQGMNGANFPNRLNTATGTVAWPQQYLEPIYFWMNTLPAGMGGEFLSTDQSTQVNRDIYFDCGSYNSACSGGFTGAAGTGYGTYAARPATCTPGPGGTYGVSPTGSYGVGYWATDANSGNGELYACTATNTWTAIYSPYTYPHPLVSGGGALSPPVISPGSSAYASPQTITVTITGPSGAAICYRTDGNAPSAAVAGTCDSGSTTYSGPFSLTIPSTGAVVEALATESGQINSSVASANYTLEACNRTPLSGNWTCVSDASNATSTSATSVTAGPFPVNASAGSLIVVFQWQEGSNVCVAPTDTLGTTFNGISTATVSADSMQLCDWYGVVSAGGTDSATCLAGSTATAMACMAVNVTGQAGASIVDQSCTRSNALSASGINNMTCANSINVGTPNELVLAAAFGDYGTRSAGANFTMIDPNNWSGEYFMEATPMIWTPSETISASGLNYGFMALTLEPYNLVQAPTGLAATVR
jgi:hypothetical protein